MKKIVWKVILIIGIVLTCACVILYCSCNICVSTSCISLHISDRIWMNEGETVENLSSYWFTFVCVTDQGNVYLKGQSKLGNYGVENPDKYNKSLKSLWIPVYQQGDAKTAQLNDFGGWIVTEKNDLYLFLNDYEKYRTPQYFCSDCRQALMDRYNKDTEPVIFILRAGGDLGYVNLSAPDDFHFLYSGVKKFRVNLYGESSCNLSVLTEDNKLILLQKPENKEEKTQVIENVKDFDMMDFSGWRIVSNGYEFRDGIKYILSYIDENQDAYINIFVEGSLDNNNIYDSKKIGEHIIAIASYNYGAAMIDEDHRLRVYGAEVGDEFGKTIFVGEVLFSDVKSVYGSFHNLAFVRTDGDELMFGKIPMFDSYDLEDYIKGREEAAASETQ